MTLPLPSGPRRVSVTLVDTMLLAPAGQQSLGALGEMLGVPKLDLPAGAITRMREFSSEEPERFRAYAERDAEIAARYTLAVWRHLDEIGALRSGGRLPPTLGAAAVNLLRSGREGSRHRPRRGARAPRPADRAGGRGPPHHVRRVLPRRAERGVLGGLHAEDDAP